MMGCREEYTSPREQPPCAKEETVGKAHRVSRGREIQGTHQRCSAARGWIGRESVANWLGAIERNTHMVREVGSVGELDKIYINEWEKKCGTEEMRSNSRDSAIAT